MTTTLTAGPAGREYPILIGEGLLHTLGAQIRSLAPLPDRIAVISDENVWRCHGAALCAALEQSEIPYSTIILPPGEQNKSAAVWAGLCSELAERKLRRNDFIVAFGGGVIGDLAGFCAASYMRGIRCLQVPTTLLAQVDSSVGGKTGINLPQGKNLLGAFWQPCAVLIDPETLSTLPARQWQCGMAEVIKYSAIHPDLSPQALPATLDWRGISSVVKTCCSIKNTLVQQDERDTGVRMLLNFGHTFGHALEQQGGFCQYTHGEAVAIGMVIAAQLSAALGLGSPSAVSQLRALLAAHALPTTFPAPLDQLLNAVRLDKKSGADSIQMVLLREIGLPTVQTIPYSTLENLSPKAVAL